MRVAEQAQRLLAGRVRRPRAPVAPDGHEALPSLGGAVDHEVADLGPALPTGAEADHGGVPDGRARREHADIAHADLASPHRVVRTDF